MRVKGRERRRGDPSVFFHKSDTVFAQWTASQALIINFFILFASLLQINLLHFHPILGILVRHLYRHTFHCPSPLCSFVLG